MAYQLPSEYPSVASNNPSIPNSFMGDDLRHFPGAKSSLRYIPTSSGSSISSSSSALFMLPQETHSYIRPGSMYLKGRVTVTATLSVVAAANVFAWAFAGQNSTAVTAAATVVGGNGSANSLFSRWTVNCGGLSMTYQNMNHYRAAILPHALSKDYVENDLRQSELSGFVKISTGVAGDNAAANKQANFSIPVPCPCFNSETAFPLLLLQGGIQIEVQTEALNAAIHSPTGAATVTAYSLDQLTLCYELTTVTEDYKRALIAAKAHSSYLIHMNDMLSLGAQNVSASTRLSIGVSLSSLKGGVFTFQPVTCVADQVTPKYYCLNGMTNYNVSINGQIVTLSNINDDTMMYIELQRALGRISDSTITSALTQVTNTTLTTLRNNYTSSAFAAGFSLENHDDWSFSSTGVPCDNIALDLTLGTPDATMFQIATANASSNMYLFLFFDSVLVIGPDGMCSLRK